MIQITSGTTTVTPDLRVGYAASRTPRTSVHRLLNGSISTTLREAALRSGTLTLLFTSEAQANACVALHRTAARFTITDPDAPWGDMTYVLSEGGNITRDLDDQTLTVWFVSIDYQEVTA